MEKSRGGPRGALGRAGGGLLGGALSKGRLVFGLLAAALLALQLTGILDSMDSRLKDYHYQKGGLVSPEIFVIGIDEETLQEYGSWQSWSRTGTAALLQALNKNPDTAPAVVGLDIGFFGESSREADRALAEAASLADNVVTTSYASFGKEIEEGEGYFSTKEKVVTYETPYDGLREHVSYGFSNVPLDSDGIVRHSLYWLEVERPEGACREYSFAAELYRKYMGSLPEQIEEGEQYGYIPYAGLPYDFYGSETSGLSFSKVVSGEIQAELFAGAIVLVGPYTSGMMDSYYTAVSHDVPMYGVEVHANILQGLLEETGKTEITGVQALALSLLLMAVILLCLRVRRVWLSACLAGLFLALFWQAAGGLYEYGFVLPLLYPLGSGVILYVFHIAFQYVRERRAKKRLEGIFGKYVSKEVASSIVKGGEEALKLGGQKKDIAVLFVDIRGFTPLSESLPPEKVVEILNRYLELTTRAVFDNQGTVDKFIGDATMAVFNAPLDLDDYVFRAVKTGLDMAKAAAGLEKELALVTDKKVGFGVGINCGEAVVGNIGTFSRMDYTAIGNTVNVAARLEGQAKAGEVVISQVVYERLKGRIQAVSIGKRALKGIAGESEVYRVEGIMEKEA